MRFSTWALLLAFFEVSSAFVPPTSTKHLSSYLQRIATINEDTDETFISLTARPFVNLKFRMIKPIDVPPTIAFEFIGECYRNKKSLLKPHYQIDFNFGNGSKISIESDDKPQLMGVYSTCFGDRVVDKRRNIQTFTLLDFKRYVNLDGICANLYQKIDDKFEAVDVELRSGETECQAAMIFGENTYIADYHRELSNPPSELIVIHNESEIPSKLHQNFKFNNALNELEVNLASSLPSLAFIMKKPFHFPRFRIDLDGCDLDGDNVIQLKFYKNPECYLEISSQGIKSGMGQMSFNHPSSWFFVDSTSFYRSYVQRPNNLTYYEVAPLCELTTLEILPYIEIEVPNDHGCNSAKLVFDGSSADKDEKLQFYVIEEGDNSFTKAPEANAAVVAFLPFAGVVCLICLLLIGGFLGYHCHNRRQKKKPKKKKKLVLPTLPTEAEEADLEPGTLSELVDREEHGAAIPPPSKHFTVIRPEPVVTQKTPSKLPGSQLATTSTTVKVLFDYHKYEHDELKEFGSQPWKSEPPPLPILINDFWKIFDYFMAVRRKTLVSDIRKEGLWFIVRDCVAFERKGFRSLSNRILEPVKPELPGSSEASPIRVFILGYDPTWIEVHWRGITPGFVFNLLECEKCKKLEKEIADSDGLASSAIYDSLWSDFVCIAKRIPFHNHSLYSLPSAKGPTDPKLVNHILIIKGDNENTEAVPLSCKKNCVITTKSHVNEIRLHSLAKDNLKPKPGTRLTYLNGDGNVLISKVMDKKLEVSTKTAWEKKTIKVEETAYPSPLETKTNDTASPSVPITLEDQRKALGNGEEGVGSDAATGGKSTDPEAENKETAPQVEPQTKAPEANDLEAENKETSPQAKAGEANDTSKKSKSTKDTSSDTSDSSKAK